MRHDKKLIKREKDEEERRGKGEGEAVVSREGRREVKDVEEEGREKEGGTWGRSERGGRSGRGGVKEEGKVGGEEGN